MKIRISIWLLLFGYMIEFIGAWMKITHQASADLALTLAALLKLVGLLLLGIFLLNHPKVKAFLDYDKFTDSFK